MADARSEIIILQYRFQDLLIHTPVISNKVEPINNCTMTPERRGQSKVSYCTQPCYTAELVEHGALSPRLTEMALVRRAEVRMTIAQDQHTFKGSSPKSCRSSEPAGQSFSYLSPSNSGSFRRAALLYIRCLFDHTRRGIYVLPFQTSLCLVISDMFFCVYPKGLV